MDAALFDPDYINNAQIKTWDGGLDIHIYPDGDTSFDMFEGTQIQSLQTAGTLTLRIQSPVPRAILLRILTERQQGWNPAYGSRLRSGLRCRGSGMAFRFSVGLRVG
jgi:hypothetical protein